MYILSKRVISVLKKEEKNLFTNNNRTFVSGVAIANKNAHSINCLHFNTGLVE